MTSPPLVVTTAGLVDIGAGELVWTRVYTAHGREDDARRPSPPPPPQQQQQRRARQQRRAPVNAGALASLVRARPTAILLLHGFPDTGELWARLGPDLARATGAAVIAPDLPGAGLSPEAARAGASCPEDVAAYGVGSLARRMLALLSTLLGGDSSPACVAGHDFGAAIAWRMAMAAPARIRRLAALSVGHPAAIAAGGARQRARFWYYLFLALSPPDQAERALARDGWALFRQVIMPEGRGGGGDAAAEDAAAVDACVARLSQSPRLLRAATNLYRANYRAEGFGATAVPNPVPGVTALGGGGGGSNLEAALGIVGRQDPALTVEQMAASCAFVLPPATWSCEVWPESGHWMMRDAPERLAQALARFFAPACGPPAAGGGRGGGEVAPPRARL
jgi:pimeloyl-ACP methyl ester carboxylesterase